MAETVQEAKDTTRWRAIWETAIVDGERVKLYKLTKGGLDQLDNAAPYNELQNLAHEVFELREILTPLVFEDLKPKVLKALDRKPHQRRTIVRNIPHGEFYKHSEILRALDYWSGKGKVVKTRHGAWKLK